VRRVLVGGFTQTSAASWARVAEQLAGDVELPDVELAHDFTTAAASLERGPAEYVGYSQGGRLCLQLTLDRPQVVRRLVLVSASPGIADPAERAARRDADEVLAQSIDRDGVRPFLERWLAQPLFATLPTDRADLDQRVRHNTVESLTHQLRVLGQGAQPSNWERLGTLDVPVLLIAGGLDAKYVDIARRMAAVIRDARVEIVAGAGHACHLEQPAAVAHLLESW
jgi:2-succinyl-6-hydroxy-2,4-cyclohexadiene-1-carboxylate synthase